MSDSRLRPSERLKRRKAISALFAHGNSVQVFPLRLVFRLVERQGRYPAQLAISVPRKRFKRAVDRNLLKRRMREAYRHNKHTLYAAIPDPSRQLALMIIYTSDEIQTFDTIERALQRALDLIIHKHLV
ncbi:MAG: ribonuclease P protein component [Saprospiraceae bacterium]|nr:ribonuclease P protein component [Saprospiraceae bacterium]